MPAGSSGSFPLSGPMCSALRTTDRASRLRGTSPRRPICTALRSVAGALRGSGHRSPSVMVSVTPWLGGYFPVSIVARLGEHIAVAVNARVKLTPVRRSSASPGISSSSQAGSVGQCWGARC